MQVEDVRTRAAVELDMPELALRSTLSPLIQRPGAALLEGWSDERRWSIVLPWPEEVLTVPWEPAEESLALLDRIDFAADLVKGFDDLPFIGGWIGFVAYEAGAALEAANAPDEFPPEPPAWFARHDRVLLVDDQKRILLVCEPRDVERSIAELRSMVAASPSGTLPSQRVHAPIEDSLGDGAFERQVGEIRESIACGDVYQVNLTRRYSVRTPVDAAALYLRMTGEEPPRCSAFIRGEDWAIASASPEVFLQFDRTTGIAESRPIKGTVRRRGNDATEITDLLGSEKDASEHLMIVDLIRNDLGKVAPPGAVRVREYRAVRTLEHVHHLESSIRGERLHGIRLRALFEALFPCGSITGAPKHAAIRRIRELEPVPRGVYTGAIGFSDVRGRSEWSVAIRTAVVDANGARYHAGGGVVWDSDPAMESRESEAKSVAFLEYFERPQ